MSNTLLDRCIAAEARMPVEHARSLLAYDPFSGILRWLPRENKNFNAKYAGKVAGSKHKGSGAIQVQLSLGDWSRLFWDHRVAWAIHFGVWPRSIVDHFDGINCNNRIDNLREADDSGNGANRHTITGTVPYRGVYFHSMRGRYAAQIKWRRSWKWLGLYDDPKDAARAYDAAAVELHGEFAVTNSSLGLLLREEAKALI